MQTTKFTPGTICPDISAFGLSGQMLSLPYIATPGNWKLIIFYRGLHCPMCANYIKELDAMQKEFAISNVEIMAICADPIEKAQEFADKHSLTLNLGYGLSVPQIQQLGLYISDPASPRETDRPFCEPGLFVLNADSLVQILDISNAPFARPELSKIKRSLDYIRLPESQRHDPYGANYPIRGRHGA